MPSPTSPECLKASPGGGPGPVGSGFTSVIWEAAFSCRTVCKRQQEAVPGVQRCEVIGEWQCEATGERHGAATGVQGSPRTESLWGVATGVQGNTRTECLRWAAIGIMGVASMVILGTTNTVVQWGTFTDVLQGRGYAASPTPPRSQPGTGGWGDGRSPFQGTP